ncbi:MAG: RNA polymerase factor sigma-54 [Verrucomicrobiaceae bacterium]|nr:RNA polymerase factor sigma-54 [Verrucomicrobiaceae bacterium]
MPNQGLYQTQTQKLIIGPQMQQSLQILQAPALELRQIIQQEINVNPVLEVETPEVSLEETQPEDPEDIDLDAISQMDEEWREYWAQSRVATGRRTDEDDRWKYLMDSIVAPTTLQEHLVMQLRTADIEDPKIIGHVEFLIGSLDDNGFLNAPLETLSLDHAIPLEELEQAVRILQRFDPVGIGTRDLRECLLVQMERLGKKGSLAYQIVDGHFDDLANRRFPILARRLGVTQENVSRAADFVSTLDPKPARRFAPSQNSYITPDIIVEKQGGEWLPVMNSDDLPRLRLSNAYKDLLAQPGSSGEVRDYIRDKLRSGKFLIRSIHQRQQTIHKIAFEILRHQREFLEKGTSHLRPLNMAQVAAEVGVHETTVSRAIAGKYMATPHGVFELRFFFSHGVKTESGEDLSNTSVKNAIAELVKTEPKHKPLSDDKLTKLLDQQGIKVARRTVAKYREAMNILPSHLRKSYS